MLQARTKAEDVWRTMFKRRQGLYELLVLPLYLCNALATSMILMNDVLCLSIDSFIIIYYDGILIFNNTHQ
jgi:hypothetical protein